MQLITGLITLISLLALTFAVPIVPTLPVSSITATLKLASLAQHHFHPRPTGTEHHSGAFTHRTGTQSFAPPTDTHSWNHPTGTYEGHHDHSGTYSFAHPTGKHTLTRPTATIYHKPTGSSAKYGQVAEEEPVSDFELFVRSSMEGNELAGATNGREGATDGGCVWECFQLACECVNAGSKSTLISKTILGLALVGAAAAVLV